MLFASIRHSVKASDIAVWKHQTYCLMLSKKD